MYLLDQMMMHHRLVCAGRRRVDVRALLGSRAFDVRYASNSAAKADIAKGSSRAQGV
jgi:hypothetical protein